MRIAREGLPLPIDPSVRQGDGQRLVVGQIGCGTGLLCQTQPVAGYGGVAVSDVGGEPLFPGG